MLSPSIRVQKDTSEEDSSGSDAGLEPEKDRFGFIVTDRSTASSVGPSPELVRQREAKWINIIVQWDQILLKRTNKIKVQCQKGIPASLRAKCWPLLCGAAARMKQNENLYQVRPKNCSRFFSRWPIFDNKPLGSAPVCIRTHRLKCIKVNDAITSEALKCCATFYSRCISVWTRSLLCRAGWT
ncbi:hypothetical protein fugu_013810 [Takifugu bimaculatus]|uniref:Rab-GAP TBC domain-containing protein n=1 Tax=Takifugu bimaculatus TaxID=433685 RepID=A0A4Z2C528_9TELE|nr:hypothetical protein fugu_013810 [Takifugu bimaculatus]